MSDDAALVELLHFLRLQSYRFITVTPATHATVLARPAPQPADLRDIFGWSRPFETRDLEPALLTLLEQAGAVESIFCILAMRDQIVPPTLNLDNPSDGCAGVDLVPHVAKERRVKAVLNNSFGFGGTNASLVMRSV